MSQPLKFRPEHKREILALKRLAYEVHTISPQTTGGPCHCGRPRGVDFAPPACYGLAILLDVYSQSLEDT